MEHFSKFGPLQNYRRMYNRENKDSGYAFFEVDRQISHFITQRPHLVGDALINCKVAAMDCDISEVQRNEMERKLFVSNLPSNTKDLELYNYFESFGALTKAYMVRNRQDGSCKKFGFVVFEQVADLEEILSSQKPIKFKGRKLTIKKAVDRMTQKTIQKKSSATCAQSFFLNNQLHLLSERGLHQPLTRTAEQFEGSRKDSSETTKILILSHALELDETTDNYRLNRPCSQAFQACPKGTVESTRRSETLGFSDAYLNANSRRPYH
jgi:hypothetical protein